MSEKFAELLYQMIYDKNCTNEENGDIIIDKLEKKLLKNEIEIEFIN